MPGAHGYSLFGQQVGQVGVVYAIHDKTDQGQLRGAQQADALTLSQRPQSITLLAKTMGLPEAVIASYLDHRPPTTITPVSRETAARQQQTADLFYENKLVPKKVDIRQRIWQPTQLEGKQL